MGAFVARGEQMIDCSGSQVSIKHLSVSLKIAAVDKHPGLFPPPVLQQLKQVVDIYDCRY